MRNFLYFIIICILLSMIYLPGCTTTNITQKQTGAQTTTTQTVAETETTAKSIAETESEIAKEMDIFSLLLYIADENTGLSRIADMYAGIDNAKGSIILDMALEKARHHHDQYQRDTALEDIMSVYVKMNDIGKAVQAAQLMSEDGLLEAVKIFSKAGHFDIAENFINKISNKDESCLFAALSYYADYAADKGNMDKVIMAADMSLDLVNSVKDDPASPLKDGENDLTCSRLRDIASLYARAGKFGRSFEVLEGIADPIEKCLALKEVSLSYIEQGKIPEGIKILDSAREMAKSIGSKGNARMLPEEIAATYIKAGEYKDALDILVNSFSHNEYIELYEYMMSNISLLTDVVINPAKEGNKDFSDEAFITLLQLADSVEPGAARGQFLLRHAVKAFINNDMMEKGEMAAAHIQNKDEKMNCYIKISKGYIKRIDEDPQNSDKLKKKALDIIREVLEYASSNPDYWHNDNSYLFSAAEICVELGLNDKAEELLDMLIAQSDGIESDSSGNWILESSAVLYCRIGQYEKGVKLANLAGDESWRKDFVLDSISKYYTEEGQISHALETIKLMELAISRGRAYTFIADKYMGLHQQDKAIEMLDKAFDEVSLSVDTTKGYHNETLALFDIADKYVELIRKGKAARALAKCLEAIEPIRERRTKAIYLAEIDVKYIQSGIEIGDLEKGILERIKNRI